MDSEFDSLSTRRASALNESIIPSDVEKESLAKMEEVLVEERDPVHGPLAGQPENLSSLKLLRFLRGFQGDVVQACDAFRNMVKFRSEHGVAAIREEVAATAGKDNPWGYAVPTVDPEFDRFAPLREIIPKGLRFPMHDDKDGHVGSLIDIGELHLKRVLRAGLEDMFFEFGIYMGEFFNLVLHDRSMREGRMAARHDLINVRELGLLQFDRACLNLFMRCFRAEACYPESVYRITDVGNGPFVTQLWKWLGPILPAHTRDKLRLVGWKFLPELLEEFDAEKIPSAWGGLSREMPYDRLMACEGGLSKLVLQRRDSHTVNLNIIEAGVEVWWSWKLESYTVTFEVHFTPAETGGGDYADNLCVQVAGPLEHDAATNATQEGTWRSPSAGTVIFTWDNTSSLLRSKTLWFAVGRGCRN